MTFIEQWEGRKAVAYRCSEGFLTIGVGHRIQKGENLPQKLSDAQIDRLLALDTAKAIGAAKRIVDDFDAHPPMVKLILVDMALNLGPSGLKKFKRAIKACNDQDYLLMSEELKDSKWFGQVGQRSKHHVDALSRIP